MERGKGKVGEREREKERVKENRKTRRIDPTGNRRFCFTTRLTFVLKHRRKKIGLNNSWKLFLVTDSPRPLSSSTIFLIEDKDI